MTALALISFLMKVLESGVFIDFTLGMEVLKTGNMVWLEVWCYKMVSWVHCVVNGLSSHSREMRAYKLVDYRFKYGGDWLCCS